MEITTINITPKWVDLVPLLVELAQRKNPESRKVVLENIYRMAEGADKWNAHVKSLNGGN